MRQNFDQSLRYVLQSEGGYVVDNGGPTNYGITQVTLNEYRRALGEDFMDVKTIPLELVSEIYLNKYWLPHCDNLSTGIDYLFFDCAVNAGPVRAIKTLQLAVGAEADGIWGARTQAALDRYTSSIPVLIREYSAERREFYEALHMPRYLRGWLNRVNISEDHALDMVNAEKKG